MFANGWTANGGQMPPSRSGSDLVIDSPPSTTSAWPVMKDERSEARKRIGLGDLVDAKPSGPSGSCR